MQQDRSGSARTLRALTFLVILVLAFLAGMLVERLQSHAQRDDMLRRYNQALREHQERLMQAEKQKPEATR